MHELTALIGIAIALAIGAMSPGPSFLIVAQTSIAHGRRAGLNTALGMGIGATIFAIAALLGLSALFSAIPVLYIVLKILGGVYLIYLGFRIWQGATHSLPEKAPVDVAEKYHRHKYFGLGFTTQVSNPKTAIVYASVFAALMPSAVSVQFMLAVLVCVFFIEAGWYVIVALTLSAKKWREGYLAYKKWVDRMAGTVMGVLGVKLASSFAS
ncbi:Threonine transporter [Pseudomonas sp. 8Z]|uniref:LysE family translocator n=1 Tax=Pseudomonas sp. 8Z TaxID=2653166 RepID=UPI0012EF5AD8|nr:LysE family translocator [Pseudomonas sp. 8Z]VXC98589.1 Threonine transporter [Pseudomonas sp. 8Z]